MKIYTKKGDKGKTYLADGTRHEKNEDVFNMMGEIDELNCWIGLCNVYYNRFFVVGAGLRPAQTPHSVWSDRSSDLSLRRIQNNLFAINSILAKAKNIKFDAKKETKFLENEIDKMETELPTLRNFILPGGHELSAIFQIARVKCRRAERQMVSYKEFIPYINRLSDYFFVLARFVNFKMGGEKKIWKN